MAVSSQTAIFSDAELQSAVFTFAPLDQVIIFSVFLRAVIYSREDGELRVRSPCGLQDDGFNRSHLSFIKHCKPSPEGDGQSSQLCFFGTLHGKRLLAIIQSDQSFTNGMLTTVRMPTKLSTDISEDSTCALFRETMERIPGGGNNTGTIRRRLRSACPAIKAQHSVSFSGQPFPVDASCNTTISPSFYQVLGRDASDLYMNADHQLQLVDCTSYANLASNCPGRIRSSYPLLWNPQPSACSKPKPTARDDS